MVSPKHFQAALLGLKAEDLIMREVVMCSREDTLQSVIVKMTQQRRSLFGLRGALGCP